MLSIDITINVMTNEPSLSNVIDLKIMTKILPITMIVAVRIRSGMGRSGGRLHLGRSLRQHIPGDRPTRTALKIQSV